MYVATSRGASTNRFRSAPACGFSSRSRRYVRRPSAFHGLGDGPSNAQIGAGFAAGAAIGVTTAISTGSKVAGGVAAALAAIAPFTGPAAPFIAVAAGLVAVLTPVFNRGCGPSCTQATAIANQAADAINKVQDAYFSQPVRTRASQLAALGLIDDVIAQLQKMCGNPALGDAGRRCISERIVRGGSAPWCPTGTGCDWFTVHRDPIANDPGVIDDPVTDAGSSIVSSVGLNPSMLVGGIPIGQLAIPALIILALLAL